MTRGDTRPSWLMLESYALGELEPERVAAIEATLDANAEARARLATIRAQADRALPPLPEPDQISAPNRARDVRVSYIGRMRAAWRGWLGWGLAGALAAAAAALLVARGGDETAAAWPDRRIAVKGGALAIDLVRERDGAITHGPDTFSPGDRFKVLVTCPATGQMRGEAVVYQAGEPSFPLAAPDMPCGNRIPLPGAFRLTDAEPAHVCFATTAQSAEPLRASLRAGPGGHQAVCVRLDPE